MSSHNNAAYLDTLGNSHLRRFENVGDVADLHEAIALRAQALDLTPDGHATKATYLDSLGNSLLCRFMHFNDIDDIERTITLQRP